MRALFNAIQIGWEKRRSSASAVANVNILANAQASVLALIDVNGVVQTVAVEPLISSVAVGTLRERVMQS